MSSGGGGTKAASAKVRPGGPIQSAKCGIRREPCADSPPRTPDIPMDLANRHSRNESGDFLQAVQSVPFIARGHA